MVEARGPRPVGACAEPAGLESGDETRAQQRGLARPGQRDDGDRPLAVPLGEALDERGDRSFPAEEPPGVSQSIETSVRINVRNIICITNPFKETRWQKFTG